MVTSERFYSVRRPLAALLVGVGVALLGGLIGLGGAEFRLPLLIAIFELYPHRAIRINLLISLATLAMSAAGRLSFLDAANLAGLRGEILAMLVGGMIAAWIGAAFLARIPKTRILGLIALLLVATAGLLALETLLSGATWVALVHDSPLRPVVAFAAGLFVGGVSSLLGVAGGEFIIPILIFIFGADIRTAGTASVLISVPVVLTGIARHWLTGHYRSRSMFQYLILPMSFGSLVGAIAGSYLAAWTPADALRIALALTLAASALKLWSKPSAAGKSQ